jgi:hypothetical protein
MLDFLFGKRIELVLEKDEFEPGEEIRGTIELISDKPVLGNKLKVDLMYYVPKMNYSDLFEKTYVSVDVGSMQQYRPYYRYSFSLKIPAEKPKIDYPPTESPDLIQKWQDDFAVGTNALMVEASLELQGGKTLKSFADVEIRYKKQFQ